MYTDLIELYGSPLTLTDREKALLAKAYSNRGNARFNLNRLNEVRVYVPCLLRGGSSPRLNDVFVSGVG